MRIGAANSLGGRGSESTDITIRVGTAASVAHQAASYSELAILEDRRGGATKREDGAIDPAENR
jgi:hypothetical protein